MLRESPWAPLKQPVFRALWIATFASNMGTLMQNVGAAWLMTSLSPSPLLVALVQTANTLPIFLLAVLAGALADIVDRRKLLLLTQGWMCAVTILLTAMTFAGWTGPWSLLGLTFALGLGAALNAPAWQAIISELVPAPELPSAVALNSMGFNLARAIAPAFGGMLVAAAGPAVCFLLNAASFVGVLTVLFRWERPVRSTRLPTEPLHEALGAGIRYVRYAPRVRAALIRAAAFMIFGSVIWALLPSISRFGLGLGPTGYGILMACLGMGAVIAALSLARMRQIFSLNQLLTVATFVYALGMLVPAVFPHVAVVCVSLVGAGYAWLTLLSNFNANVQAATPAWVRGRALAAYLLVAFGGQALGAAIWGATAGAIGLWATMAICGTGVFLNLALVKRYPLTSPAPELRETSAEAPAEAAAWRHEAGSIRIAIAYRIDPAEERAFRELARDLRLTRLRNGARSWELATDERESGLYVERFEVESGTALMRLYERMTASERALEAQVQAFHQEPEPPRLALARIEA